MFSVGMVYIFLHNVHPFSSAVGLALPKVNVVCTTVQNAMHCSLDSYSILYLAAHCFIDRLPDARGVSRV